MENFTDSSSSDNENNEEDDFSAFSGLSQELMQSSADLFDDDEVADPFDEPVISTAEHQLTIHKECLAANFCRVCGQLSGNKRGCTRLISDDLKKKLVLLSSGSYQEDESNEVHPDQICHTCYAKVHRRFAQREKANSRERHSITVAVANFQPHDFSKG